jgi:F0F1-type ATP synthase assembly protein I
MEERDQTETTTEPESRDISWRTAMIVSGLALSLPAMLFGPPAIGYWLDLLLGTKPWLFLAFLAIGFVGTAVDVYIILKRTRVLS